jgi:hypothetical protein
MPRYCLIILTMAASSRSEHSHRAPTTIDPERQTGFRRLAMLDLARWQETPAMCTHIRLPLPFEPGNGVVWRQTPGVCTHIGLSLPGQEPGVITSQDISNQHSNLVSRLPTRALMSGFPRHILNPDATEEQVLDLEGGGEARQERLADEGQAWPACGGAIPPL